MARTFGGTLDAVVTDTRGNTLAGINVHAWDAATGGVALGSTVSGPDGSFELTLDTTAPGVYVSAGTTGPRRYVPAREAVPDLVTSLANKTNNATTAALSDLVDTTETRVGTVEDELSTGRLSASALDSTIAREVAPLKEVKAPRVVSLLSGQADEVPTVTGGTYSADTVNKRVGTQSHKLTSSGAATISASFTFDAFSQKTAGVGILVYVEDVTKLTALTFDLHNGDVNSRHTVNASKTGNGTFAQVVKTGWNLLRWPSARVVDKAGTPAPWGTFSGVRVNVVTNAATSVSVQQLTAEVRAKASLLFIHDGGYTAWDQSPGYHDLRDRNVPVTWSIDCGLIGDSTHITEARLAEVAAENRNSISFHGYDATSMAAASGTEAVRHTMKAIRWLAARGYTGRIWRSAWLQNQAANAPATDSLVLVNPMYGTGTGGATETIHNWPFSNRKNLSRTQLHGRTNAELDTMFAEMEANHGVLVGYTHSVSSSGASNITPASWAYLLSKIDAGIQAGWLEAVTLEMLLASSGVGLKQGLGGAYVAEWPEADGTVTRMQLP